MKNSENKIIIDDALIDSVSKVARLNLTETERINIKEDMKNILEAFSEIDECNTDNVEELIHPVIIEPTLREDVPHKPSDRDDLLRLTKHTKEGYFKGPKAL